MNKALIFVFLATVLPTFSAVTDVVIPQRDALTTFAQRTITGSSYPYGLLGFDASGVLSASTIIALGTDPADAGVIRLENAATIAWESDAPGTDYTLTLTNAEKFFFSADVISTNFYATGQSYYINTGGTVFWKAGTGSPEAAVTGSIGSLWSQTDGTTNTALWRKETGVGTNTGWVAVSASGSGDAILANAQTFTAQNTFNLFPRIPHTALASVLGGSTWTLVSGTYYSGATSAARTIVLPASPTTGDEIVIAELIVTSGPITVTLPASIYRLGASSTSATIALPTGNHRLSFRCTDGGADLWSLADTGVDAEAAYTFYANPTTGALQPTFVATDTPADGEILSWQTGGALEWLPAADATLAGSQTFTGQKTFTVAAPQLILGVNTTTLGSIKMFGNTSGDVTLSPAAAAGTATAITLPAATDTLVGKATTDTLTNKTLDASATGNVVKLKGYIYLTHPHLADGTGATIGTTATSITYGHATFSHSAAKTGNYVEYFLQVPEDIDTAVALRGRLKVLLGDADTNDQNWLISSVSVADSAVPGSATLANEIALDYTADATGASGDVETTAWTTLTDWAGALTAGQTWRIRLMRAGDTSDASTVNSTELGLVLEYGVTQ